jgi:acyl-CoA reductase-like NAD-dependent aldehyde dehydrogenase
MTASYDVINPATEQVVTTVEQAGVEQTDAAINRAQRAFSEWRSASPGDRAAVLRRFAAAVDADREQLAQLEVTNCGHTIMNARDETDQVRDVLTYYAGAPERLIGQQIPVADGVDVTFHEPLGVVGVIVPWNFPMVIASWGFAPALAAGNCVVLKPAELTPLTALRLAELSRAAGIPEGVFEVLPGKGSIIGRRLVGHPDVAKIVFTGSTDVGRAVMAAAAAHLKPVTLELGGKSANVIFADADLAMAAGAAPSAVFDNAGQDCCARSRILVQRDVFDEFLELFEAAVKGFVVTDPTDEQSQMGPLISADHRARVAAYVPPGAPVAFTGTAPNGPGYWYPPTVLTPTDPNDRTLHEEIFGPLVTVVPFVDEADAVRLANATPFGLSGSIWTNDVGRALRVARGIESGTLSINSNSSVRYWTPFGGVKASGLGRELGPDAALAFTETKNLFISTKAAKEITE